MDKYSKILIDVNESYCEHVLFIQEHLQNKSDCYLTLYAFIAEAGGVPVTYVASAVAAGIPKPPF